MAIGPFFPPELELKGELALYIRPAVQQRAALCRPVVASRQWPVTLAKAHHARQGGGASSSMNSQPAAQPIQGGIDRQHSAGAGGEPLS